MTEIIYPEKSYKIIGILFEAHSKLGYGLRERDYQKTVAILFKNNKISF